MNTFRISTLIVTLGMTVAGGVCSILIVSSLSGSNPVQPATVAALGAAVVQVALGYLLGLQAIQARAQGGNHLPAPGQQVYTELDRPLSPSGGPRIMFVAKTVSVEVVWQRGGQEIPVGWIDYPVKPEQDFLEIDGVLTPYLDESVTTGASRAHMANQRLAQAQAEQVGRPPAGQHPPATSPATRGGPARGQRQ